MIECTPSTNSSKFTHDLTIRSCHLERWTGTERHTKYIEGDIAHLTLHAAGPPGEQFGLGERQLEPGTTLLVNLRIR
jgi:hypothetical protein